MVGKSGPGASLVSGASELASEAATCSMLAGEQWDQTRERSWECPMWEVGLFSLIFGAFEVFENKVLKENWA